MGNTGFLTNKEIYIKTILNIYFLSTKIIKTNLFIHSFFQMAKWHQDSRGHISLVVALKSPIIFAESNLASGDRSHKNVYTLWPKNIILENLSQEINLKEENELCKDVYSCPKYYHLKLETAFLNKLTNSLKYRIHWERMWSLDVAITEEEKNKSIVHPLLP